MTLADFLRDTQQQIETALQQTFAKAVSPLLTEAIHYSLLDGGKRLRPALVRAAAELANSETSLWLIPAQSVEMIHVYSLIHDDLPAMDNDDLRRGKATSHKQFDEAIAILAGDALQAEAFATLAQQTLLTDRQARQMIATLAYGAGADGMVGGQIIDLQSEHKALTLNQLAQLHALKTGALIRASLRLGALCSPNVEQDVIDGLDRFGQAIGLAFQIVDDILDVTSTTEILGKPQGSDLLLEKSTYVSLLGLEGARQKAQEQHQLATHELQNLNQTSQSHLWQLADYILGRKS